MSAEMKHPELDAMETVFKALEPLPEEARVRVLAWVSSALQLPSTSLKVGISPAAGLGQFAQTGATKLQPELKIDDFLTSKHPSTISQRLACLAYYLEYHDGIVDITTKELQKANSDARQGTLPNWGQSLSDATLKYGYFSPAGGHKRRLTPRAKAVVEALPDQEAVKLAHVDHPIKRIGKRTKASKSK